MTLGKDLVLAINGTPLAAAKSCDLDINLSFFPISQPTSGKWDHSLPKRISWNVSADALIGTMDAYNSLLNAQLNQTLITIRIYNAGDYGLNRTGTAYIDSLHLTGQIGALCKMSIKLKGTGALSGYNGTVITPTNAFSVERYYYDNQGGGLYVATYEQGDSVDGKTITLSQRTKVRINPMGNTVFLSSSSSIMMKAQDLENLTPQDYDQVITTTTELWLNGSMNYLIYSIVSTDQPIIMNLM